VVSVDPIGVSGPRRHSSGCSSSEKGCKDADVSGGSSRPC
jgi:hypothetical protein